VAAASALLAKGADVLMVDVGETLEPAQAGRRARMAGSAPGQWLREDVDAVKAPAPPHQTGMIRPYGSDVPFRVPAVAGDWSGLAREIALRPSFAKGGLSNGWGASVLPYRDEDLGAWPIRAADLERHYGAVASLIGLAAPGDELASLFPAHRPQDERPLPLSTQAQRLLDRFTARRAELAELGAHASPSWQAVAEGCRRCAMCLHGCPYGLIFNAGDTVERLRASPGFTYRPNALAMRFEETADGVRLWTRDAAGELTELSADRLFVAAGVLPTALLVLDSLDQPDQTLALRDSRHFILPMLQRWSADPDPATEPRHTLAQLFVEIVDPRVAANTVHVQIYTHNDGFAVDMRRRFGASAGALAPLIGALSRRLIVAQTFLHSDVSPTLDVVMRRDGGRARLEVVAANGSHKAHAAQLARVKRHVARIGRRVDLLPLTRFARVGAPGSSFHCGGTFPMREKPRALETDVLGRLASLQRVHLVDASVFPSIPATTITFSAMANAHRIATEAIK